mmetsp:Transcript_22668/g.62942  ORF Transcript_22668/g.62942 Transcript_22668/m.62942 type:complete len:269 (-) Transcript_22668:543-1349(-)
MHLHAMRMLEVATLTTSAPFSLEGDNCWAGSCSLTYADTMLDSTSAMPASIVACAHSSSSTCTRRACMRASCPRWLRQVRSAMTSLSRSLASSRRLPAPVTSWSSTSAADSMLSRSDMSLVRTSIITSMPPSSTTSPRISSSWQRVCRTLRELVCSRLVSGVSSATTSSSTCTTPASCAASCPTSMFTRRSRASAAVARVAVSSIVLSSTMPTRPGTTSVACSSRDRSSSSPASLFRTVAARCCSAGVPSSISCTVAAMPPASTIAAL